MAQVVYKGAAVTQILNPRRSSIIALNVDR
jgi:hypothetical protein